MEIGRRGKGNRENVSVVDLYASVIGMSKKDCKRSMFLVDEID